MSLNQMFIAELQQEAAKTRKMLERVNLEDANWKPHEKSMSLGRLATHIAELPSWVTNAIETDELDFASRTSKPHIAATNEELVSILDENINKAVASLENVTEEDLEKPWIIRNGEHIVSKESKKNIIRNWALNHGYHHRGQLSVYLRLTETAVPGMFGPSFDDRNQNQ